MSTEESARPGPSAPEPAPTSAPDAAHLAQLHSVRAELSRLEEIICAGHHPVSGATSSVTHSLSHGAERVHDAAKQVHVPAWLRDTRGESRWPVAGMIVVAIALQLALPDRLTLVSKWMLPGLEAALLLALIAVNPTRLRSTVTPLVK